MKDVALDLADIDETWETLSVSTGSGTSVTALGVPASTSRLRLLPIAAIIVGVIGITFGAWQWLGGGAGASRTAGSALEVTTIARIPDMKEGLMSADGRSLAFTQNQAGRFSLIVRQMATSQDVVVVPQQEREIWLIAVAPDSSYYFTMNITSPGTGAASRAGGRRRTRRVMGYVREMAFSGWQPAGGDCAGRGAGEARTGHRERRWHRAPHARGLASRQRLRTSLVA
jgi:hypothetical protein